MNTDPRVRRGAHRSSRDARATLLPSLLAILAVTSLITALYVWRGDDAKTPPAAASVTQTPEALSPGTTPGSATPATTPSSTSSTESADEQSSAPATSKSAKTSSDLTSDIAVVVLNQSSRRGLAATVASRLRNKGWSVSGVGNFRGVVPATTVYFPVGHEAAALAAAKNLATAARVRPRFGNLSNNRLTVVVTASYPG
jgi:LytR cell envelope-related transcriptional attenuator